MSRHTFIGASALGALTAGILLAAGAPALAGGPSADPTTPPKFTRVNVDTNLPGASFSASGDVYGDDRPELVVSSYNKLVCDGEGANCKPAPAGRLQIYRNGSDLTQWTKQQVFDESAGIMFPNQVTVSDVNGDGKNDLIVPAGYFFDLETDQVGGQTKNRGTLSWWENRGPDQTWVRHDLETGSPYSFHGVQHVDLDGDGVKDILTSGENGGATFSWEDDDVVTRYYKGSLDTATNTATFAAPVTLSLNGGSSPQVADIDGDGALDIVVAQFFGVETEQSTYLWLERVGDVDEDGVLSAANFVKHEMSPMTSTGRGFQMKLVPDLRGDGVDRWIGTNHLLHPFSTPPGQMHELTPNADVRLPGTSTSIAGDFYPRTRFGQGAPGVFGYGDLDGDNDTDFALSGDGDHRVFWVEQKADGSFERHTLVDYVAPPEGVVETDPNKRGFGQAGGALVVDLDGDGLKEIEFSSFDEHMVAIWTRSAPVKVTSKLALAGGGTVTAGTTRTLTATLTSSKATAARTAKVTFKANRTGATTNVATVKLAPTGTPGVYRGSLKVTAKESGRFSAAYTGATRSPLLSDTSASASTTITAASTLTGFATKSVVIKKKAKKKKRTLTSTVTVAPGFGRTVTLQKRSCAPSKSSCAWKTVKSYKVSSANKAKVVYKPAKGTSYWRVTAVATKAGTAVTSKVRKVTRR